MGVERFIEAQENSYSLALSEIKKGRKVSHWMWYIFPQIEGLGQTNYSDYYAIKTFEEAKEYVQNELLYNRLIEISSALLELNNNNPEEVMGYVDSLKLKSSMTLFYLVTNNDLFKKVLDKYYQGAKCEYTVNKFNNR